MDFEIALAIVAALIVIVGIFSGIVSIWLVIKYYKYNRRPNSAGLTGVEMARSILDANGLQHIKVKRNGSLLFGNSYSHYFKKVRLRGHIRHQTSLTSVGMGAQKAALAILDKEGDPDMKKRVRMIPIMTFGPIAFIPLIAIGVALDYFMHEGTGTFTIVLAAIGFLLYAYSIVLSVATLKTEKKAQERAYEILKNDYAITNDELVALKELFRLYNIQYINDIILSTLELIYYALRILSAVNGNGSSSSNK